MKLNDLKKIIKEEIAKVLNEEETKTAPTREKEKIEKKPSTTPSRTKPNRETNPVERPKDKAEDAAKEIAEKIGNRYAKMLKNKK